MDTAVTVDDDDAPKSNKYYTVIKESLVIVNNRKIYDYICNSCHKRKENHTNAMRHCRKCWLTHHSGNQQLTIEKSFKIPQPTTKVHTTPPAIPDPTDPPARLPLSLARLVQLFASQNYAFTGIDDPNWHNFLQVVAPDFPVPSSQQLREAIIQYSVILTHQGLSDLRGEVCGLALDGATVNDSHFYGLILVHISRLRLLAISEVPDQKSKTIALLIKDAYELCEKYQIHISAIVTDNASNLTSLFDGTNRFMFASLLGQEILRIACAAHTGQLAIVSFRKNNKSFSDFF